jgi:PE family
MSVVVTQRESLAAEISTLAATQFVMHVPTYQAVSAKTGTVHQVFTTTSAVSGEPHVATEAANPVAAA